MLLSDACFSIVFRMFGIIQRYFLGAVALLCFAGVWGCISVPSGPRIVIGNATESHVAEATLASGVRAYQFSDIGPFSVSASKPRTEAFQESLTLAWMTREGIRKSQTIELGKELLDYSGHMQFEISADGGVRVFTAPSEDGGDSVLPWSMPANWEGAPTIPGMNM